MLSLTDDKRFEVYTSPLFLATGAYFAEKKGGRTMGRKKIELLASKLEITSMGPKAVERTMADARITDLEDGFKYFSSLDAGCSCIVAYDKRDWKFAAVEVLSPEDLMLKHAVRQR